jgi:hypothetical protein
MPSKEMATSNISAAENWPNSGRVRRLFYGVSTLGGNMSKARTQKRSRRLPERRRAIREESTYGLASSVALACDRFFERRGIVPENHCWSKIREINIEYLTE